MAAWTGVTTVQVRAGSGIGTPSMAALITGSF
jgi:hypothetical protein